MLRRFCRALGGETPGVLGAGLEELFRFVPTLRQEGVDVVLDIYRAVCIMGGACAGTLLLLLCRGGEQIKRLS